jgi:hypothetical protein
LVGHSETAVESVSLLMTRRITISPLLRIADNALI